MRAKIVAIEYKCLHCGNLQGSSLRNGNEMWWWKYLQHGNIGPFCSEECANAMLPAPQPIKIEDPPRYTLEEFERLYFLRWRVENGHTSLPIIQPQE